MGWTLVLGQSKGGRVRFVVRSRVCELTGRLPW